MVCPYNQNCSKLEDMKDLIENPSPKIQQIMCNFGLDKSPDVFLLNLLKSVYCSSDKYFEDCMEFKRLEGMATS